VAAAWALPGCGLLGEDPAPPPEPDPLTPLLAGTLALVARYDTALVALADLTDRLTPIRQAHVTHAADLAKLIGIPASSGSPTPGASGSPAGSPADARGTLAALRTAEQSGQRDAAAACLAAPAARAALLGSIAAARASHAEALR